MKLSKELVGKYIAEDEDGVQTKFYDKPEINGTYWTGKLFGSETYTKIFDLGDNWKESLHRFVEKGGEVTLEKVVEFKFDKGDLVKVSSEYSGTTLFKLFSHISDEKYIFFDSPEDPYDVSSYKPLKLIAKVGTF